MGFGNHGMSDEGIRVYKKMHKDLEEESREERRGVMLAWDDWTDANGIDIEWKRKRKVRIMKHDLIRHCHNDQNTLPCAV